MTDRTRDPYWCRLCADTHPVRSISDMHNAKVDQEEQ